MLYPIFAQAAVFLDPGTDHLSKPLGFSIPALSYGTQLCMERPNCCIKGHSYEHIYENLACPKILMNVTVSYYEWAATHMSGKTHKLVYKYRAMDTVTSWMKFLDGKVSEIAITESLASADTN